MRPATIPPTALRVMIQEQAASLAATAEISVEEATSTIEQVVFAGVSYPPKSWLDKVDNLIFNEFIKQSVRCSRCGEYTNTGKTTLHGLIICEPCSEFRGTPIINEKTRTGRNDPCPCGSGKKFKACCRV